MGSGICTGSGQSYTSNIFYYPRERELLKYIYIRQADVVTAYLNAALDEEVFIKLPKVCGDNPTQV